MPVVNNLFQNKYEGSPTKDFTVSRIFKDIGGYSSEYGTPEVVLCGLSIFKTVKELLKKYRRRDFEKEEHDFIVCLNNKENPLPIRVIPNKDIGTNKIFVLDNKAYGAMLLLNKLKST